MINASINDGFVWYDCLSAANAVTYFVCSWQNKQGSHIAVKIIALLNKYLAIRLVL